jgi:2-polyprenyl-3-methyl-5-hydroxy-6-metoxy-1,4-benzoquinol methylase/predicted RNA-binding Zn-ribbon protein involved in translation (DUF1610 family)
VSGLRALGRDARLFLPDGGVNVDGLIAATGFDRGWLINESGLPNIPWECIVLDRFQTPPEELARWSNLAPVIGIDEGGVSRNCFNFLIDILPGRYRSGANIADVSLLPLRPHTEDTGEHGGHGGKKVLVSFGQEDAAGLGLAVAEALAEENSGTADITLLWGGLKNPTPQGGDAAPPTPHSPLPTPHIIPTIPNLVNHLTDYDLIITHYGITAFEALYMGVPVLLVSPGALHEKLARAAGFCSMGVGKASAKKLRRRLFNKGVINHLFFDRLKERCAALAVRYNFSYTHRQSLAELINGITPDVSRNCPACGAALNSPVLARYAQRTYRRCPRCGIIAMDRLTPPPIEYGKEYFFEQYQQQYGKTYIEDFPNLTAMAKRRLAVIKRLLQNSSHGGTEDTEEIQGFTTPRLLDIGCAYGPFLAAAREEGFSPCGIDPAEDAVRYVTDTLGIPAVHGFFPTPHSPLPTPYSVITLWYVIEHFRDCGPVLAEIRKLLMPGGVLAFATPSFTGVSGCASLKGFLERSPADHWTIWSPTSAKRVLKMAGFKVKKIMNSGHHPERFPFLGKYALSAKSPLYRLLMAISKIFSLGDTFEVYAYSASPLFSAKIKHAPQ